MDRSEDDSNSLSDQAIEWIVRLHSGRETRSDVDAFERWRQISHAHESAAREAEAIWSGIGTAGAKIREQTRRRGQPRVTRRALLGFASAGLIGGGLFQTGLLRLNFFSDYSTNIGEWKTIRLPDGSTAELNARSAFSLAFDQRRRLISLWEGQATFTLAHDRERPFVVAAREGMSSAESGKFDVDLRPDEVAVTVIDGNATVSIDSDGQAETAAANQRILYGTRGFLTAAEDVDAASETAWRRRKLVFNNRKLAEVVAEVERYRYGKIVLVGSALQDLSVSGVFDLADPRSVLTTIADTLPVHVTELPMVTIIRSI